MTRITLTWVREIVMVNLDYNACLNDQVEKEISRIGQSNEPTTHILIHINVRIEQQIRKCHKHCQETQNTIMSKTWASGYTVKLNVKIEYRYS